MTANRSSCKKVDDKMTIFGHESQKYQVYSLQIENRYIFSFRTTTNNKMRTDREKIGESHSQHICGMLHGKHIAYSM